MLNASSCVRKVRGFLLRCLLTTRCLAQAFGIGVWVIFLQHAGQAPVDGGAIHPEHPADIRPGPCFGPHGADQGIVLRGIRRLVLRAAIT